MPIYDSWSKFYDEIYSDRTKDIKRVHGLIQKYKPNAEKVLDLACGTGKVTARLADFYNVTGLDISEGQIAEAKKNYPKIPFYVEDMTKIDLNQKFDVILCLFNSINHVTSFESWIEMFSKVSEHLTSDGVFIFDINTIFKLEKAAEVPGVFVSEFGDNNFRYIDIVKESEDPRMYAWNVKLFEHLGEKKYQLHEDKITELGISKDSILDELKTHFNKVQMTTKKGEPVTEEARSIMFVCK